MPELRVLPDVWPVQPAARLLLPVLSVGPARLPVLLPHGHGRFGDDNHQPHDHLQLGPVTTWDRFAEALNHAYLQGALSMEDVADLNVALDERDDFERALPV